MPLSHTAQIAGSEYRRTELQDGLLGLALLQETQGPSGFLLVQSTLSPSMLLNYVVSVHAVALNPKDLKYIVNCEYSYPSAVYSLGEQGTSSLTDIMGFFHPWPISCTITNDASCD